MKTRVSFLVDRFNLYHSLCDLEIERGEKVKWLDIHGVCRSLLSSIQSLGDDQLGVENIFYFTARVSHYQNANPQRVSRQKVYIRAIQTTGVKIVEGSFRKKYLTCRKCGRIYTAHEEKMTDVAIACKALELCHTALTDAIVFITGDTDQVPPLEYIRQYFPQIFRVIAFPRGRVNNELRIYSDADLILSSAIYRSNQLPDLIIPSSGRTIKKPPTW